MAEAKSVHFSGPVQLGIYSYLRQSNHETVRQLPVQHKQMIELMCASAGLHPLKGKHSQDRASRKITVGPTVRLSVPARAFVACRRVACFKTYTIPMPAYPPTATVPAPAVSPRRFYPTQHLPSHARPQPNWSMKRRAHPPLSLWMPRQAHPSPARPQLNQSMPRLAYPPVL